MGPLSKTHDNVSKRVHRDDAHDYEPKLGLHSLIVRLYTDFSERLFGDHGRTDAVFSILTGLASTNNCNDSKCRALAIFKDEDALIFENEGERFDSDVLAHDHVC